MQKHLNALIAAIQGCTRVRLAYSRSSDEVISMHEVAPVDIRTGWTARTAKTLYVWAWCYAERELEMHLLDRVRSVQALSPSFDPAEILSNWPTDKWPIPDEWTVPREWGAGP